MAPGSALLLLGLSQVPSRSASTHGGPSKALSSHQLPRTRGFVQPSGRTPGNLPANFLAATGNDFLQIANDRCRGSTIAHDRQRSLAAAQRSGDDPSTIRHRFPWRLKKALSQLASRRKIDSGPTCWAAGPSPDHSPRRSRRCAARRPPRSRRSRPPGALLRAAAGGTWRSSPHRTRSARSR